MFEKKACLSPQMELFSKPDEIFVNREERENAIVRKSFELANHYGLTIKITFDLRGGAAGRAVYKTNTVRYNPAFLQTDFPDMYEDTVPHEVAHLVAGPDAGHGPKWRKIMHAFGRPNPERCHQYNLDAVWHHRAKCKCRTFAISPRRYNFIQRGKRYRCKTCKIIWVLIPETEARLSGVEQR